MKKNNKYFYLLILFLLWSYSCSSSSYFKLKIEMPFESNVPISEFDEVIVTDFYLLNQVDDFDLNQELVGYLSSEIGMQVSADVKTTAVEIKDEAALENEEFWQNLALSTEKAILISGSVEYSHETRKALIGKEKKQFEDPFPSSRELTARKFYTLTLDLYLIDSETGKTLFNQEFKETKSYSNPNQTSYFAFFDLTYMVKEKLFRILFGSERVQERYLIVK